VSRPNPDDLTASEPRYVSTAQAAEALGVSVTTVKRWVDDGVLPAHRTVGKHRKLLVEDLFRLVRDGGLPQADLSRLVPIAPAESDELEFIERELVVAARTGDANRIRHLIHGAYRNGRSIELLADRVIAPALRQLGHDWEVGRVEIMHEHRTTQACLSALYELKVFLRANAQKERPIAVGGAPEHDHYHLPTLLAQLTLLDSGWEAINLGPHTPMSAFRTALDKFHPRLIWISISQLVNPEDFLVGYNAFYKEAEAQGVAVAIGGRGLSPTVRERMGYTSFGDGLTHLAALARSLQDRPARSRRGRPPGGGQAAKPPEQPGANEAGE